MWDEHISSISCALRNSLHSTIKCSPYFAAFGFHMITHGDSYKLLRNVNLLDEPTISLNREDQLALLRKEIRKNILVGHDINKRHYDLRTRPTTYNEGQIVYRRNFAQSNAINHFNAKLAPVFIKAKVLSKIGNNYYKLQDIESTATGTYHGKDIRT